MTEVTDLPLENILGLQFDQNGKWSAKDVGNTPVYRKMNRKERRLAAKRDRKLQKLREKYENSSNQ